MSNRFSIIMLLLMFTGCIDSSSDIYITKEYYNSGNLKAIYVVERDTLKYYYVFYDFPNVIDSANIYVLGEYDVLKFDKQGTRINSSRQPFTVMALDTGRVGKKLLIITTIEQYRGLNNTLEITVENSKQEHVFDTVSNLQTDTEQVIHTLTLPYYTVDTGNYRISIKYEFYENFTKSMIREYQIHKWIYISDSI